MKPGSGVESLYVFENFLPGLCSGIKKGLPYPFNLLAPEKAFHNYIIPAISPFYFAIDTPYVHGAEQFVFSQNFLEFLACILYP